MTKKTIKLKSNLLQKENNYSFKDNKSVILGPKDSSLSSLSSNAWRCRLIIDKRLFRVHNRSCDVSKDAIGVWNTCDLCSFVIEYFEC